MNRRIAILSPIICQTEKKRTLRPHKGRTHILLPAPATSSHYFHKYHKKKDDLFGKGKKMLYLCAI